MATVITPKKKNLVSAKKIHYIKKKTEYLVLQMGNLYFDRILQVFDCEVANTASHHIAVQGHAVTLSIL